MSADQQRIGRRGFLGLALGGAVGVGIGAAASSWGEAESPEVAAEPTFHGRHQAGIATPAPAQAALIGFSLRSTVTAADLGRLLRVWTGSIAALTAGRPAPGDPVPTLASPGTQLTATVAVGRRVVEVAGRDPDEVSLTIPPFGIDRLDPRWSGGDLAVQLCAADATTISHAAQVLQRDAAAFAAPVWWQRGFSGTRPDGRTRNLLGHIEGTGNPQPGTPGFDETVWRVDGPAWLRGGTTMAVRRIRLDLNGWSRLGGGEQDAVIGRRAIDGSPLGRPSPADPPDFAVLATEPRGHVHTGVAAPHPHAELAIPEDAHLRRAHPSLLDGARIFRRGYGYDDGAGDAGLLFLSFQRDLESFVAVQRSLAELDALNTWSTPVGSAAFAVLPGCEEGDWLGRSLVDG